MAKIIQLRRDTKARWEQFNPLLREGEIAVETDTWLYKIGDGIRPWLQLPYAPLVADSFGVVDGGAPDSDFNAIEDINGGTP